MTVLYLDWSAEGTLGFVGGPLALSHCEAQDSCSMGGTIQYSVYIVCTNDVKLQDPPPLP